MKNFSLDIRPSKIKPARGLETSSTNDPETVAAYPWITETWPNLTWPNMT